LGEGLTTPRREKKELVTKFYMEPRNWTDPLERPKQRKIGTRFGTWNVKSLYRGSLLKKCWFGRDYAEDLGVDGGNNIRTYLREMGWEVVNWMHVAQDRDHWRALVNSVMKLSVP
jgi:hypothetical protein